MYDCEFPLFPLAVIVGRAFMIVPQLDSPVVLVHGLFGYDRVPLGPMGWDYFRGIRRSLEAAGNRVLVPQLPMTDGTECRARRLQWFIRRHAGNEPVHLIAHSMGGLDSRHLITHLEAPGRVLSLTTVGTPHRGSPFADWMLRRLESMFKPLFQVLHIPFRAFVDLTSAACAAFNTRTPDVPGVRYFSVAGRCAGPWLTLPWRLPHTIVGRAEGENDGVVSIQSARWGEHTDVWDGDHLALINVCNHAARRRGLWTDRVDLYGNLIRRLADLGY